VDQKERKAAQRHDRLEVELNNYKTNLIKESIRMGHNDMGDFYYGRGDLQVNDSFIQITPLYLTITALRADMYQQATSCGSFVGATGQKGC